MNGDGVIDVEDVKMLGDVEPECPEGQPDGLEEILYGLEQTECHEVVMFREAHDNATLRLMLETEEGITDHCAQEYMFDRLDERVAEC